MISFFNLFVNEKQTLLILDGDGGSTDLFMRLFLEFVCEWKTNSTDSAMVDLLTFSWLLQRIPNFRSFVCNIITIMIIVCNHHHHHCIQPPSSSLYKITIIIIACNIITFIITVCNISMVVFIIIKKDFSINSRLYHQHCHPHNPPPLHNHEDDDDEKFT